MTTIRGKVFKGYGRGTHYTVPTANIHVKNTMRDGVYAARVRIDGQKYNAVAFVGRAQTFDRKERWCEVHIFNWGRLLYGTWISVEFIAFIRLNKKFPSTVALKKQILLDIRAAQQLLQ